MRIIMIAWLSLVALALLLSEVRAMDAIEPHISAPSPGVLSIAIGPLLKIGGMAVQPDGTIAVAASTTVDRPGQGVLLRITTEGRLADPGIAPITAVTITPNDVALAPDDKIVVIGAGSDPAKKHAATQQLSDDFLVARFLPDGRPDTSFARQGWSLTDVGERDDHDVPYGVAVQPDGRIVVAGQSLVWQWLLTSYSFATVRYDLDGSLDKSFGDRGRVITRMGVSREDSAVAVLLQRDGKIVVAGNADSWRDSDRSERRDFALARYLPDGRLDKTFGQNGKAGPIGPLGLGLLANGVCAAALDSRGRILVGGSVTVSDDRPRSQRIVRAATLARYESSGGLDRSFGKDGLIKLPPGDDLDTICAVAADPDGKIVASGRITGRACGSCFGVMRLTPDGDVDHGFGDDGFVAVPFVRLPPASGGHSLAVQKDGKILVLGQRIYRQGEPPAIILARLNPDGTPDASFGAADPTQLR